MTSTLLLAAALSSALASEDITLMSGEPAAAPCLSESACGDALRGAVSHTLDRFGLMFQSDPVATSALGGKGMGLVVEVRADSVPVGPQSALEELGPTPPALPRLSIGYQHGSYTHDDPDPQLAIGLTALPPLRVFGGTVGSAQLDLSGAVPVGGQLWIGAEVGYGVAHIGLPLVGASPALGSTLEGSQPACSGSDCVDRLLQTAAHGRIGLSFEPVPALFGYARTALVSVDQRLAVAVDETRWQRSGLQVQGQLGAGLRAGDRYQLTVGSTVAHHATEVSSQPMVKVLATSSFRFGRARYWEERLTADQLAAR